jgi:uncharacterized membrane protein
MGEGRHGWSDQRVEQTVGNLLRAGVLLAGAVVLLGAVLYLAQEGAAVPDYEKFKSEPPGLRDVGDILAGALALEGKAVIQVGILMLLATPVARVAFSVVAFALQRDRLYVLVTLFVLGVLLAGLTGLLP